MPKHLRLSCDIFKIWAEITESLIDESVTSGVKLSVAVPALATLDYVVKQVFK